MILQSQEIKKLGVRSQLFEAIRYTKSFFVARFILKLRFAKSGNEKARLAVGLQKAGGLQGNAIEHLIPLLSFLDGLFDR